MAYINVESILEEDCFINEEELLSLLEDDTLIQELQYRDYLVFETDPTVDYDTTDVEWYVKNGNLKEALIQLERLFPSLKGITDLHKE